MTPNHWVVAVLIQKFDLFIIHFIMYYFKIKQQGFEYLNVFFMMEDLSWLINKH
jgi:hypothetical protein